MQNDPLSVVILLAIKEMYFNKYIDELLDDIAIQYGINYKTEDEDNKILMFTEEEVRQYLIEYIRKYSAEDFYKKLTTVEEELFWTVLTNLFSDGSIPDELRNNVKKLIPYLFTLIQETQDKYLIEALEKLMDRNEENIHKFFDAILQFNKITKEFLEFIASLLCNNDSNARLQVYAGIQKLYNKGLIDDKDLDLIYDKFIKECNKEQLQPT